MVLPPSPVATGDGSHLPSSLTLPVSRAVTSPKPPPSWGTRRMQSPVKISAAAPGGAARYGFLTVINAFAVAMSQEL